MCDPREDELGDRLGAQRLSHVEGPEDLLRCGGFFFFLEHDNRVLWI